MEVNAPDRLSQVSLGCHFLPPNLAGSQVTRWFGKPENSKPSPPDVGAAELSAVISPPAYPPAFQQLWQVQWMVAKSISHHPRIPGF